MKSKAHVLTVGILLSLLGVFFIKGCDNSSLASTEEPEKPEINIKLEPVAPDVELETVTWNLEWYGEPGEGPSDEIQQSENILQVIDSLRADLYAFQEIDDQSDLSRIAGAMEGYRGFVADFIGYSQRTAFIYNTSVIDSLSSGPVTEGQDEHAWAGRLPFYFEFDYRYQDYTTTIYAIVIHAKATAEEESYLRRKQAAEDLYSYLTSNKPDARIIFLGDYNDDVDESIYNGEPTPYKSFVEDTQEFTVVTKIFSENGVSSTVNTSYPDIIDHIIISNELDGVFIEESQQVYTKAADFITNYGSTTSDHYPVRAKFNLSGN